MHQLDRQLIYSQWDDIDIPPTISNLKAKTKIGEASNKLEEFKPKVSVSEKDEDEDSSSKKGDIGSESESESFSIEKSLQSPQNNPMKASGEFKSGYMCFHDCYHGYVPVALIRPYHTGPSNSYSKNEVSDIRIPVTANRENPNEKIDRKLRFAQAGWDLKAEDTKEWLKHAVSNYFLANSSSKNLGSKKKRQLKQQQQQQQQYNNNNEKGKDEGDDVDEEKETENFEVENEEPLPMKHIVHQFGGPNLNLQIMKQGWMKKKSDNLKVWRWRWVILTPNSLLTFKWLVPYQDYSKPTNSLIFSESKNKNENPNDLKVKKSKKHGTLRLTIDYKGKVYLFQVKDQTQVNEWMYAFNCCKEKLYGVKSDKYVIVKK